MVEHSCSELFKTFPGNAIGVITMLALRRLQNSFTTLLAHDVRSRVVEPFTHVRFLSSQKPKSRKNTSRRRGRTAAAREAPREGDRQYSIASTPTAVAVPEAVVPPSSPTPFHPVLKVVGVGGAGGNAVNNMIERGLSGIEFIVANTDSQALELSPCPTKIQLGQELTKGLGAGADPAVGLGAAEESMPEIRKALSGAHMVFVACGLGGGTGTGGAPAFARVARDLGVLTVAVVTTPFAFEGARRSRAAQEGLKMLSSYVDTTICIPNQRLFALADRRTSLNDAFKLADTVLYESVKAVTDLMVVPGMVNLDFADVKSIMHNMGGRAIMGVGEGSGEDRASVAARAAVSNPLLNDEANGIALDGARGLLINVCGGMDMTLLEVDEAASIIRQCVDENAHIIFGSTVDPALQGRIRVSIVATGISVLE